jgi:hypothetical protein
LAPEPRSCRVRIPQWSNALISPRYENWRPQDGIRKIPQNIHHMDGRVQGAGRKKTSTSGRKAPENRGLARTFLRQGMQETQNSARFPMACGSPGARGPGRAKRAFYCWRTIGGRSSGRQAGRGSERLGAQNVFGGRMDLDREARSEECGHPKLASLSKNGARLIREGGSGGRKRGRQRGTLLKNLCLLRIKLRKLLISKDTQFCIKAQRFLKPHACSVALSSKDSDSSGGLRLDLAPIFPLDVHIDCLFTQLDLVDYRRILIETHHVIRHALLAHDLL